MSKEKVLVPPPIENFMGENYEMTLKPMSLFERKIFTPKGRILIHYSIKDGNIRLEMQNGDVKEFKNGDYKITWSKANDMRHYCFKASNKESGLKKFYVTRVENKQMSEDGWNEFEMRLGITKNKVLGALGAVQDILG